MTLVKWATLWLCPQYELIRHFASNSVQVVPVTSCQTEMPSLRMKNGQQYCDDDSQNRSEENSLVFALFRDNAEARADRV